MCWKREREEGGGREGVRAQRWRGDTLGFGISGNE